jgi:purine nucleosidase
MTARIIIDCDPGVDDALAILLAAGVPELDVVALTTVAGNQTLAKVTENARRIAAAAHLDVPIAPGCDRPLVREQVLAGEIHGDTGLGDVRWPDPLRELDSRHAVDLIVDEVMARPGEVTLVPIGPLTNIAMALRQEPRIVDAVAGVVLMGGSYTRGNTTPAAEFNIFVDPEAAAAVFSAGWTVTMIGLDLTRQVTITPELISRVRGLDSPVARLVLDTMAFYNSAIGQLARSADTADTAETGGVPVKAGSLHDPAAVAYVMDPSLFSTVDAVVQVETAGALTYGMTVTDFDLRGRDANTRVATRIDAAGFYDRLVSAIAALPV